MLRYLSLLLFVAACGYCAWYGVEHYDELIAYVSPSQRAEKPILTFEASCTPEELMKSHEKELVKDANHALSKANVQFLPFLLMDVKYVRPDKKTEEAKLIWSMENGEMVLDTQSFETTHGFEDCIKAKALDDDFRILHEVQRHNGQMTKEALCQALGMDPDIVFERLEALRRKHLVAIRGDMVRIHLDSPLLHVQPQTKVYHYFVTKIVPGTSEIVPHYSKDQIRRIAQACFGPDFAIRQEHILYVPIFQINVQNPDGSTQKTYWNAVTCKRIELKRLL